MNIRQLHHDKITFKYTDQVQTLSRKAIKGMLAELNRWRDVFIKEKTYVNERWNVPSLLVRLDGVLGEDSTFRSYEIQEGCGWVGYAGVVNESFREIRDDMFHSLWPKFKVLMSKKGRVHDDALWLEPITIEQALLNNEPLMVRHHMVRYPHLHETIIARSVMPVRTHQDKTYGIKMGWWRTVRLGEPLPWDEHFVLKPFKSWGSKDVMCWIPDDRRGRSTRTQIENTLRKHDSMILQPYIEPTKINIAGVPHNSILRPFFGYNPHTDAWVPMGGLWTARPSPNLRIHGTSDAISGPLIIEE